MRRRPIFSGDSLRGLCILALFLPQPAAAQQRGAAQALGSKSSPQGESASLILGTVAGDRGSSVSIPLYYQPGKNPPLRTAHLEVEFVSNSVKFAKAEKGLAAETQDYDLAVDVKELPPDKKKVQRTRLGIDVSVAEADPQKSLPEGLWAFLNFRIPADAKPFSISLNPVSVSGQDTQKRKVDLAVEAGKIIVSVPDVPLVGCFFFNH